MKRKKRRGVGESYKCTGSNRQVEGQISVRNDY